MRRHEPGVGGYPSGSKSVESLVPPPPGPGAGVKRASTQAGDYEEAILRVRHQHEHCTAADCSVLEALDVIEGTAKALAGIGRPT